MRGAVPAAQQTGGAVTGAVAGGVAAAGRGRFHLQFQIDAAAASVFAVAAGIGPVLVPPEIQGKAAFRDLDRAELQSPGGMPFPRAVPAVAPRRGPGAGTGVEHMPDERFTVARVLALDGNAEAPAPAGHGAVRAGGRQGPDDGLYDFLGAMGRGQGDRRAGIGPNHAALPGDHLDGTERAVVLRRLRVEQKGQGHRHARLHVGMGRVDERGNLVVRSAQVDFQIAALDGGLGPDRDILVAPPIVVQQGDTVIDTVLPGGDDIAGLGFGSIENDIDGGQDHIGVKLVHQLLQPPLAQAHRTDLGGQIALEIARMAHIRRQHLHHVLVQHAARIQAQGRHPQPLLPDFRGRGVVGAVGGAADIGMMRPVDRPEQQSPAREDRDEGG